MKYISYREEDYLLLSGIQHFAFCRRQWALIHIEQLWDDNGSTVEGILMHKRAHDEKYISKRGNTLTVRALKIHSSELGLSGECDVVEFYRSENGISLSSYSGMWIPYPIEYKRGTIKEHDADILQLCAEAMCLEEMLCCKIDKGAMYYGEIHRRQEVIFSDAIREKVKSSVKEMHEMYNRGYTPKVKPTTSCHACSLKDLCLPKLLRKISVKEYMRHELEDEVNV